MRYISPYRMIGWNILPFLRTKKGRVNILQQKPSNSICYWVCGAFMMVKADYFLQAGMFDDSTFLYFEEVILAERLLQINKKVYFLADVEVLHYEGGSSSNINLRKQQFLIDSQVLYYKNINMYHLLLFTYINCLLLSITSLIKNQKQSMKIKTLTTYDVYNYGASLQAYALQHFLSNLGHDVEIINYQPYYLTRKYDYKWVNPESKLSKFILTRIAYRIMKYLQRQTTLRRKKAFDIFNHQILKETSVKYTSYKSLCDNPPKADLYIVGSDQIWNVFYEAGRDPAFFLEFVKQGYKASYAASFSYLEIDTENKIRIKNH